jgi:hypothetical protein
MALIILLKSLGQLLDRFLQFIELLVKLIQHSSAGQAASNRSKAAGRKSTTEIKTILHDQRPKLGRWPLQI